MKRGTQEHPKTRRLARQIRMPIFAAMGLVECLAHWAYKFAQDGAIGKFEDDEIADGVGWEGDPAELIRALVHAGFVDQHQDLRLVIHDWPEHADTAIHMSLARARRWFWDGSQPKLTHFNQAEREPIAAFYREHSAPESHNLATKGPSRGHEMPASLSSPVSSSPVSSSPRISDLSALADADAAPGGAKRATGRSKSKLDYSDEFEAAWSAYGKDRGKKTRAYREFQLALREIRKRADAPDDAYAWLMGRIEAFQEASADTERRFIPHMERWLKDGGFDSEFTTPERVDPRRIKLAAMFDQEGRQ